MKTRKNLGLSWNFSSSKGSYLLEFGILSLGVAFLTAGIWDLVAITHARNSLDAALQHGLRCAYPADAACIVPGSIPTTSDGPIRYNAWVTLENPDPNTYVSPLEEGEAWGQRYTENFAQINEVSKNITHSQSLVNDTHYKQIAKLYAVQAKKLNFSLVNPLPFVVGNALNPYFRARLPNDKSSDNAGAQVASALSASASDISYVSVIPGSRIKSTEYFNIPPSAFISNYDTMRQTLLEEKIFSESVLPCINDVGVAGEEKCSLVDNFSGMDIPSTPKLLATNPGADDSNYNEICAEKTDSPVFGYAQALIHISGSVISGSSNSDDKVKMFLEVEGCNRPPRDLGGRLVETGSSGNFMVRGVNQALLRQDDLESYDTYDREIAEHHHVMIPIGKKFRLKFVLESNSASTVGWQGERVRIFLPRYEFKSQEFRCHNLVRYQASDVTCDPGITGKYITVPKPNYTESISVPPTHKQVLSTQCSKDAITAETDDYKWEPDLLASQSCNKSLIKWDCPNGAKIQWYKGIARGKGDGCAEPVLTEQQIETLCPTPQAVIAKREANLATPRVNFFSNEKLGDTPKEFNLTSCNGEELPPTCADQTSLPPRYSHSGPCPAGQMPPVHVRTQKMIKNSCNPNAPKDAAYALITNNGQLEQPISTYKIDTNSKDSAQEKVWPDGPPQDACVVVKKIDSDTSDHKREYLCETHATKTQAERCCAFSPGNCRLEIINPPRNNPSGGVESVVDLSIAKNVAEASLATLGLGGSGANSKSYSEAIDFKFAHNSLNGANDLVIASGTIQVPVILADYFTGDAHSAVTVTREVSKRLERGLIIGSR